MPPTQSGGISPTVGPGSDDVNPSPSLKDVLSMWWQIGLLSFGGPAAQIALMHKFIVQERRLLSEQQYLNALSFCMLLPGPEAMQLATYVGWRLHGLRGGLVAGLLFVIPGAVIILLLAIAYAYLGDVALFSALFLGIKSAVLVIVLQAFLKVAQKAFLTLWHALTGLLAFVAIYTLNVPFPVIVLVAGIAGWYFSIHWQKVSGDEAPVQFPTREDFQSTIKTVLVWLLLWFAPFVLLWIFGADTFLLQLGKFFSTLAVVTFGGAYAVLAYLAQDVVTHFGWLTPGEMLDALGLAETTPGPLILVTEFTGFLAGFREGGLALGLVAALLTLWVTFTPCFLWIFAGAPYLEWLLTLTRLRGALTLITAAVVGVMFNLSVWFAINMMFFEKAQWQYGPFKVLAPNLTSIDFRVFILVLISAVLFYVFRFSVAKLLATMAVLGVILTYVATLL